MSQCQQLQESEADNDQAKILPEVPGVPVPAHGPGVGAGEDELVAGPAPRLHLLCIVALAEDLVHSKIKLINRTVLKYPPGPGRRSR